MSACNCWNCQIMRLLRGDPPRVAEQPPSDPEHSKPVGVALGSGRFLFGDPPLCPSGACTICDAAREQKRAAAKAQAEAVHASVDKHDEERRHASAEIFTADFEDYVLRALGQSRPDIALVTAETLTRAVCERVGHAELFVGPSTSRVRPPLQCKRCLAAVFPAVQP